MRAMILAAGFGTRLASLGMDLPKPLFPVCNVPLIRWALSFLVGHGFDDIVVNLHHRGALLRETLGDGRSLGARISYSVEEGEILGTGGGIKKALSFFRQSTDPLVVMNGKVISDVDLWAAIHHHRRTGALGTMVLAPSADAARWGSIGVDTQGRIRRFLGTPHPHDTSEVEITEAMFTGIHVLEPELVEALPEGPSCIVRAGYRPSFERGLPLSGYMHRGYFWDHSTPERWLRGNLNLVQSNVHPPVTIPFAPAPLRGVHPTAQVAADARIHAASLVGRGTTIESGAEIGPGVVVGEGARVSSGAQLVNVLVHRDATVAGVVRDAIVTGEGRIYPVNPEDTGPTTGPALGAARPG